MAKCRLRKKNGSRCSANAQPAIGLCVFHDPARASDGHRARRAEGLSRTRSTVLAPDTPDHPLGTTTEIARLLGDSINQIRLGELDPRVANAMGYMASVLLKALQQGPVEERLAYLEAILVKSSSGSHIFNFTQKRETLSEQSSETTKGD
jgi:hypothetical protein